jgi:hypothetical protein
MLVSLALIIEASHWYFALVAGTLSWNLNVATQVNPVSCLFRKSLAKHFKVETSNISSRKVGDIWKHSGNWKATSKCSVKFYLHSRLDLQFLSTLLIKEFIDKCRFCWVAVMHCNMLPQLYYAYTTLQCANTLRMRIINVWVSDVNSLLRLNKSWMTC